MASGRKVNLHHGARFVLAESLGVPPGLLCRRANTIVVAKTSGFIMSPAWEIECRVLERVGILPVEYYTDMIVMWSENYDVQIGMDSSVIVGGDVAFDLETRDIVKIDYIVGHRPIVFHSGWIGCAPVCLTMGSDYRFAPNLVLLRAAPLAFSVRNYRWEPRGRRGGRCSKAMWHMCARWRARRAAKAEQMEEELIMFPAEQVFGGGRRPWCRRCGCIDAFEGLTNECCARTRGQACQFDPPSPRVRLRAMSGA